jgi:branched-chain amino acid transport system substrate-binding protein
MKKGISRVLKWLWLALFVPAVALAQAPVKLAMIEGLSGGNANGGEAVFRNLVWALERVNERGGVRLPGGARRLVLERYDSKGQNRGGAVAVARGHRRRRAVRPAGQLVRRDAAR